MAENLQINETADSRRTELCLPLLLHLLIIVVTWFTSSHFFLRFFLSHHVLLQIILLQPATHAMSTLAALIHTVPFQFSCSRDSRNSSSNSVSIISSIFIRLLATIPPLSVNHSSWTWALTKCEFTTTKKLMLVNTFHSRLNRLTWQFNYHLASSILALALGSHSLAVASYQKTLFSKLVIVCTCVG